MDALITVARMAVGLILLAAGVGKVSFERGLTVHPRFVDVVLDFRILPPSAAPAVARTLPFLELAAGIGLVVGGALALPAAIGSALLFSAFGVAIVINLLRGRRDIDCGCFGVDRGHGLSWPLAIRSFMLAATAAAVAFGHLTSGVRGLEYFAEGLAAAFVACAASVLWPLVRAVAALWRTGDPALPAPVAVSETGRRDR